MDELDLRRQLDANKNAKWVDVRLKSVRRLSKASLQQLRSLVQQQDRGYAHERKFDARVEQTARLFDGLDERQRERLWEGLFPGMTPHVERAWAAANERPYSFGYQRLPFRAPGRGAVARESRARFFLMLCDALRGFEPTPEWLAAWAPHLTRDYRDPHAVAWLLAAVLRGGGKDADTVRSVIVDSINGDHEIGRMGNHAIATLLNSHERSDWEVIGKLLLAAQRQEGLRQSILETVDEANPAAFRHMLGIILEHDLGRFSSVVRAFDVWLGMQWAGGSVKVVHTGLRKLCEYLDDAHARATVVNTGEAEDAYLAAWAAAFADVDEALRHAAVLANDDDPARRYAGLLIAARAGLLPETVELCADRLLRGVEQDERVLTFICRHLAGIDFQRCRYPVSNELFDAAAALFERFPAKKKPLDTLIWPWDSFVRERRVAAQSLSALATGNPKKMLPYAGALDGFQTARLVKELAGIDSYWDHETQSAKPRKRRTMASDERAFVVRMLADARQDVHSAAFSALAGSKVTADEVELLTGNLHRTGASFRQCAIARLSQLPPTELFSVGESLLGAKQAKKRAAGLELLEPLLDNKKLASKVRALVRQHEDALADDVDLAAAASRLLGESAEVVTLDDCLGLVPPGSRATPIVPKPTGVVRDTPAARACLRSLAELFLAHGETEIERPRDPDDIGASGEREHITSYFPSPWGVSKKNNSDPNAVLEHLPLREVWAEWVKSRGNQLRDKDGLELVRAWALADGWDTDWEKKLPKQFGATMGWRLGFSFSSLVDWLLFLEPHEGALALLVQSVEDRVALIKKSKSREKLAGKAKRGASTVLDDYNVIRRFTGMTARLPGDEKLLARLGALQLVAMDLGHGVDGPGIDRFCAAYDHGLANENDFTWLLLKPRGRDRASKYDHHHDRITFGPIREATGLKPTGELVERPELVAAAGRVRERLIEVELTRGELPTPASRPASEIRFAGGAEVLFRLVSALGKDKIIRQDQWGEPTRAYSFSRLISVTTPLETDTHERFQELADAHAIKPTRLLEIGMFAPQWAGHIEQVTGSRGFEEAVWWIHAHTKRSDVWRSGDIRELWAAQIKERTELDAEDLEEGAVDVAWFKRIIGEIGEDAWASYQKPAKYASNSGGHKRAQLFADAMLGRVAAEELLTRIDGKRHQDAVRALGLVPLPTNAAAETLRRYARLQEFRRESRKFGSQRQASEGRAVDIGMQNLARTAGYRDPRRLEWAMEAEAVADLAQGPVTVTADETSVSLSITASGAPALEVRKKGKPLKNVPAKLRKHPEIAELRSRMTDLRRQGSRMRLSLEESMCRGDAFTGAELADLCAHPMLRPMVERLVFVASDAAAASLIGYPEKGGKVLRDSAGNTEPVGKRDTLRLAHPTDLLARGDWHEWQRECFAAERVQPFKQVFRETYPRTEAERGKSHMSRRYAGHQVNPRQALSLLKKRQWVFAPEEGCRRVYHDEQIVAELWFQEHFYTPAEIEGLTLEGVAFRGKGADGKRVALANVPGRVFSETMRDLDLVVSVAHAGGVDPEASASTIEMRATLLRETCQLLGLSNVRVDGHHAVIDGTRASYSVHLGSATARVIPGRMLVIVAVHSQYRGRLFLPFADDDPRTAEVIAKTLLLARDHEIKDPSILDQIG